MPRPTANPGSRPSPQKLPVAGGEIAYEVAGRGPSLVFVHSVIADRRMWDREFERYSETHRVLRYDLRGFGGSTPATTPFSYVDDLSSLIAHTGLSDPVLVGSSAGGGIAIDFTLERPQSVRGLLLSASGISGGIPPPFAPDEQAALDLDDTQSRAVVEAWSKGDRAGAFEQLRGLWCSALRGEALERFRSMVEQNAVEVFESRSDQKATPVRPAAFGRLPSIRIPTTVLAGDRDNPSMEYFARRIARSIPDARLVRVSGADHLINLSRPDAFDAALDSLLSTVRERSAGPS